MTQPRLEVVPVPVDDILALREDYRREMSCQIVHDSWHARGFTDSYLLTVGGGVVGYGSVGGPPGEAHDILKECFITPAARGAALSLCRLLIEASGARTIEAQTNDSFLTCLLFDCAQDFSSEILLFADGHTTSLPANGATVRGLNAAERTQAFHHTIEPVGDWGLELGGEIVATGGFLTHYNHPYADLFMEANAAVQRRGFGSYLVQELKRLCCESGRTPGARCGQANVRSRATLQRAGMFPCARIIRGRVAA